MAALLSLLLPSSLPLSSLPLSSLPLSSLPSDVEEEDTVAVLVPLPLPLFPIFNEEAIDECTIRRDMIVLQSKLFHP